MKVARFTGRFGIHMIPNRYAAIRRIFDAVFENTLLDWQAARKKPIFNKGVSECINLNSLVHYACY
jgi:hypothetical protein